MKTSVLRLESKATQITFVSREGTATFLDKIIRVAHAVSLHDAGSNTLVRWYCLHKLAQTFPGVCKKMR